ncbi:MAG: XRE family transcriptional regulator, partial [Deltaproteobacteria bacterium]
MNWDGERLKGLVQERGFTLVRLAGTLNVSRQALTDWTNGQVPKGSHLVALSKVLNVPPGYFFPEDETPPISVPLHRKRGVAKVTSSMEEASQKMAREYESLFRSAPAPGIVPIMR